MIKKLRRKFILVAMLSVLAVLAAIIGGINIANYAVVQQNASDIMDVLAENGGQFPKRQPEPPERGGKHGGHRELSPEAPYEARFFTVHLNDRGDIIAIDISRIAAVSSENAIQYAFEVAASGRQNGYYGSYMYRLIDTAYGTLYIFLDCGRNLDTFYRFLWASIGISAAGLLVVFILVCFFSRLVLRPVAESYEKQKQFITDASHEIKTPLTVIDANTEIIEMETGESQWTESIHRQISRLTAMTNNLVFLARMDEDNSHSEMAEFCLSDAVEETVRPFLALAETQEKELLLDICPGLTYKGNEAAIRYLVSILMDNAMKYSDPHGRIEFLLRASGSHSEMICRNTVEEIEQGDLSHLFERFYRRDASRNSATGGSGIGLSAAKATVEAHKGKITARSADGKSVEFRVEL